MPVSIASSRKHLLLKLGDAFHVTGKQDQLPDSPVPHLLKSNVPPSEEEKKKIEAALLDARVHAVSLQRELGQVPVNGANSAQRRTKLQDVLIQTELFIDKHQSFLSLYHSLPDELVNLIFIHCLPTTKSRAWGYRTWGSNPSFRLSQVCRRWREIALSESRLWVILGDVHLTVKTAKVNSTYCQFLEELLRRSRNMDLWIFVHCPPYEALPMGNVHPVIDILVKHEKRWHVLGIQASVRTVKAICEPITGTMAPSSSSSPNAPRLSLPRLQKLDLDIRTQNQGNQIVGFAHAPALTEVGIAGTYPLILLPFNQLRVYSQATNGGPEIDGPVTEVIKVATGLERLELIGEQQTIALSNRAVIDNLKVLHLRLDDTRQNIGDGILDNLVLPKLEELKVASYSFNIIQALSSLVHRSLAMTTDFPLRKVTLRQIHPADGTMMEFLKLTPHLEELVIEFPAVTQILELLNTTRDQDPPEYIPKLRSLVVYAYPKNVDEREDEVCQLAQAMLTRTSSNSKSHATAAYPTLRLIFPTRDSAHHGQVTLNNWGTNFSSSAEPLQRLGQDKLLSLLQSFRSFLEVNIPELKADRFMLRLYERPPPKRKHDLGFSRRLDGIFNEIEELKIMERDISVLYVSKLHLCLHRLSKLCERDIYGDKKHNFRARAQRILKKWSNIMLVDLRNTDTRWALMGMRSLIYIRKDDPLRTSTKALDMILGFYDFSDLEDSTWSDHV